MDATRVMQALRELEEALRDRALRPEPLPVRMAPCARCGSYDADVTMLVGGYCARLCPECRTAWAAECYAPRGEVAERWRAWACAEIRLQRTMRHGYAGAPETDLFPPGDAADECRAVNFALIQSAAAWVAAGKGE